MENVMTNRTILIFLFLSVASYGGTYSGGDGNDISPYEIDNVADWLELMADSNDWDKHFVLTSDIDMEGFAMTPVGNDSNMFTGVFDGNGNIISNIEILQSASDFVGLFGYSYGGHIRNLGVENVDISGSQYVGGLCGQSKGTINTCYATGTVIGNTYVGGLVGFQSGFSHISNCYATCSVNGDSTVGGLVGKNEFSMIKNCYATGTVIGNDNFVGGLVGLTSLATSSACFWDVETSGQARNINDGAIGASIAALYNPESYLRVFWDFKGEITNGKNDIWAMPPEGGYPVLAWQLEESSVSNDEMDWAISITAGDVNTGTTTSATGMDITKNGYNDTADVWYSFDCPETDEYTITLESNDFDTTLGVFDEAQREVAFNDDFYGKVSLVILKAEASKRYYLRAAGYDGQTGDFTLTVTQGAIQAIHGDLNYDGFVNFGDFAIFAGQWLTGL